MFPQFKYKTHSLSYVHDPYEFHVEEDSQYIRMTYINT